jgi:hypothetical protein
MQRTLFRIPHLYMCLALLGCGGSPAASSDTSTHASNDASRTDAPAVSQTPALVRPVADVAPTTPAIPDHVQRSDLLPQSQPQSIPTDDNAETGAATEPAAIDGGRKGTHFTKPTIKPGDVAPDFTLKSPDGKKTVSLSGLRGKPVVLVFGSYT